MSCCSEYAKGLIGTTGCPSGEIQTWLRIGSYDEGAGVGGGVPGHLRQGELLPRADGPRPRHREAGARRPARAQARTSASRSSPPTTRTTCTPTTATPTTPCCASASAPRISDPKPDEVRGRRLLHQVRRGDALALGGQARPQGGVRQHPAHRRAVRGRVRRVRRRLHGPRRRPGRPHRGVLVRRGGLARASSTGTAPTPSDEVRARTEMELQVIRDKGYCGYYLVVADFINWAKDHGIRVGPGRGSGAGSIAAYALRITDLCPLQHGLIFERFLNPERPSMPDFDIDFDERRRGEVIQYVSDKYGSDRVAQIATFGRLKSKAAIKDANRVLDYPFAMGERITKALPADVMGKGVALKELFDPEHKRYSDGKDFRELHESDAEVRKIYDTARRPRGADPPVGRARRRRHHEQRAADRHRADHEARAGRRDHHPVRLPDVRGARAGQDGLPGPAQPHRARRRRRQHQGQPRRRPRARGAPVRRRRRPTPCSAAATPSACSSSTAARCASCCAPCSPTTSRTSPRSSRSTGPARWAPTATPTTPSARPASRRSPRSIPSSPSRSTRSSAPRTA